MHDSLTDYRRCLRCNLYTNRRHPVLRRDGNLWRGIATDGIPRRRPHLLFIGLRATESDTARGLPFCGDEHRLIRMIWEYAELTCAYTLTKEVACPVEYT